MRILLAAVSALALAACGEGMSGAPAPGAKTSDAAAWAKYQPWNSDLPEVQKTGSGLECVVLASGPEAGVLPRWSEQAEVFYEGRLNSGGGAFDSAFLRGRSATFPVNAVVPGFSEALQLMKPGDRRLCYLPYQLAYGVSGQGKIPPAADLLFEIDLVSVQP